MTDAAEPPCRQVDAQPTGWVPDDELSHFSARQRSASGASGWGLERVLGPVACTGDPGAEPLSRWSCPEEGR